jgi:hypothetical protein
LGFRMDDGAKETGVYGLGLTDFGRL